MRNLGKMWDCRSNIYLKKEFLLAFSWCKYFKESDLQTFMSFAMNILLQAIFKIYVKFMSNLCQIKSNLWKYWIYYKDYLTHLCFWPRQELFYSHFLQNLSFRKNLMFCTLEKNFQRNILNYFRCSCQTCSMKKVFNNLWNSGSSRLKQRKNLPGGAL